MNEKLTLVEKKDDETVIIQAKTSDKIAETEMNVVHDYVAFCGNVQVQNENGSDFCSIRATIQIPIRTMIRSVLPLLNDHEYCQEERLINAEGKQTYCYYKQALVYYDSAQRKEMVKIIVPGSGEEVVMSREAYNKIFNE